MDLNQFIKKSHLRAVEKFNADLEAFVKETGDNTLYEDVNTPFTLSNVRVENGKLCYTFDGAEESENQVYLDSEDNQYYESEGLDSIPEYIKFWRACLRRARRYWTMSPEQLDRLSDGEEEEEDSELTD